jgi:hypothetical protein
VLCFRNSDLLTDWERGFIVSISRRPIHRLSRKQLDILERLTRAIMAQRGT